ncbi:MAG: bifunctional riboflavin kinase/FAD synthetase [candidate division Zixibacteria bacterium]|nr:bifunctional riboflavin kinase/FAD synthetase [candidate division Zixibacteria bacterium]
MSLTVYRSANEYALKDGRPCIATLGTFDGFHLGHASIFERIHQIGKSQGLPPVVVTFHPHPRVVVTPNDPPLLLTTPDEKIAILESRFNGALVILTFDDSLRQMTADDFVREILLRKFGIQSLVVGYDHSFGKNRSGTIEHLEELAKSESFNLEVVGPVTYKDMPISSSRIRRAIKNGEWKETIAMMGHPYPIHGKVVKGLGRGKKLGWPTINLDWSERKLLPRQGVYSCVASVDGERFKGMMFIGVNMFNPEKSVSVEANLFDFNRDIYGHEVTLCPIHFMRENMKYDSAKELSRQIANDKEDILKLL